MPSGVRGVPGVLTVGRSGARRAVVDHGVFVILNMAIGGRPPEADGATAGPATEPGHPMRVDRVTVSVRQVSSAPGQGSG
ncbi:hypothetical protein [Streptomyces fimicarius] [Streptomyces griseus]